VDPNAGRLPKAVSELGASGVTSRLNTDLMAGNEASKESD